MEAVQDLFKWLIERNATEEVATTPLMQVVRHQRAAQLIMHLSTMTMQRRTKAPQICIQAKVDSGKTTLRNLLDKTYPHRCFTVSHEASRAFQPQPFFNKRSNAIYMDDEFSEAMYNAFYPAHFNKVAEGALDTYIACKNTTQRHCSFTGFLILMSNYQIEEIAKTKVTQEEFKRRFTKYIH